MAAERTQAADLTSAGTQSATSVASGQTQSSRGPVLEATPHAVRDNTLEHAVVPEPLVHDQNTGAPVARNGTGGSSSLEAIEPSTGSTVFDSTSHRVEPSSGSTVFDSTSHRVEPSSGSTVFDSTSHRVEPSTGSTVFDSTSHRVMDDGNASEAVEQDLNPVVPTTGNDTGSSSSIEATDLPETASNTSATGPSETLAAETLGERELLTTLADQLGTLLVSDDGGMTGQATVTTLADQLGTLVSDDGGMTGQATGTVVAAETVGGSEPLAAGVDSMTELPGSSAVDPADQWTVAAADDQWSVHPIRDHLFQSFWNSLFLPDSETDNADQLVRLLDSITEPLDVQRREASQFYVPLGLSEMFASRVDGSRYPRSRRYYRRAVEEPTLLSSDDRELFKACERGLDLDWTKSLLENGANVNAILDEASRNSLATRSSLGDTPLHTLTHALDWNCDSQNILDHVRLLGDWGAVPDTVNLPGVTPLMLAVKKQCPRTVQLLVDLSRDVNGRSPDRRTALHLCFRNPQDVHSSGFSLLAEQHCFQMAASLINAGARTEVMDAAFQTPLVLAIRNGCPLGARFLILQNCDPNYPAWDADGVDRSADDRSPFTACLETGDWRTLHLLLQAGCRYRHVTWAQFGGAGSAARELAPDLVSRCCQPRSLMESCRLAVRRTLRVMGAVGDRMGRAVEELPVPVPYRNFLLLKDQGPGFCSVS